MGVSISALALAIVLQGPGDGWAFVHDTGKVKTLYWELFDTTEVWLRLIPEGGAGEAELEPAVLRSMLGARGLSGEGLGFTFRLTAEDQRLLAEFADAVGLRREPR